MTRVRFRPHPKGFGFAVPVGADGVTPTEVRHVGEGGPQRFDSLFVPPQLAGGRLADDLLEVEFEVDEKGASVTSATLVERPLSMLVGTVVHGPGGVVVEPDGAQGSGWVDCEPALATQLAQAMGRQVVVLLGQGEEGAPLGRALVAGPHVVGSPSAARANAVAVAFGRAAPSLVPGGPAAAGLDAVTATATATRIVGLLAGGRRGGAAGLDTTGPVPGLELPRTDRVAETTVTVDDVTTRDVDDALHASWSGEAADPVAVAVHIADPAAAVGAGSPADVYARVMAATSYLEVGASAPMLDPALAEDTLSLLPGQERGALSVRFTVAADGTVDGVEVEAAIVRSDAKCSYAALEAWMDGVPAALHAQVHTGVDPAAVDATLTAVREAADRLGVERDTRGTLEALFTQPELDPAIVDGRIRTRPAEPHATAYRLVERLMVAANEAVAGWLVAHEVPALYRVHAGLDRDRLPRLRAAAELATVEVPAFAVPDEEVDLDRALTELVAALDSVGEGSTRELLSTVIASSVARASYEPDPSQHRGLASAAYVHFTSPIRRYADLVVHRQLRSALAGEQPVHAADELGPLAGWLDARAGAASYAARRERDELVGILLERGLAKDGEEVVVTGVTPNGLRVRLPRLGVTGFLLAEKLLGTPRGERASLEVDERGLTTTSGPWQVGTRLVVDVKGRDFAGRLDLRPRR